jgi:serine/threonine-protein kinase
MPRDLLFGLLALQNGLISSNELIAAFALWTASDGPPMADVLCGSGALAVSDRALVDALVRVHLKIHDDADKNRAALELNHCNGERHTADGESVVEANLALVGSGLSSDAERTCTYAIAAAPGGGQRFRVLRPHARGGLGAVFVAFDAELHREVALKQILDKHTDDPVSRQRFVLEAEITGGLEHPGIVPVYSFGADGAGRPYYAMRFIRGVCLKEAIGQFHANYGGCAERSKGYRKWPASLTVCLDDSSPTTIDPGHRSLELRKLLRRFLDVCDAIDYAHSRGVLHRDIKPSNIIVGEHGETLVVDWGLAKATGKSDPGSSERTLRPSSGSGSAETLPGSALGTPAFMSPEQAEGVLQQVGPHSDVYSLGATLYCLLTAVPPFAGDAVDVIPAVRKGAFPPPRVIDPSIDRALESICLKAMALRPADRYRSCRALAEDIERWMADEPVSAWREPFSRRARRWVERNRTTVAATVVALVAGVVGLGAIAGVQARANTALKKANDATARALGETRNAQAETRAALAKSEDSRQQAETVSNFLIDALRSLDPAQTGREVKVAYVLDRASAQLEQGFAGSQATKGKLLDTLGTTYRGLGLYDKAVSLHTKARTVREVALGLDDAETLESRSNLAVAYYEAGQTAEAIALHETTLTLREARLGPDHPDTLQSRNYLANAYDAAGRKSEAAALYEATLKLRESKLGPDHRDTLQSRGNVAIAYRAAGRLSEAIALSESTLKVQEAKLGPDHPDTLKSRNNLAIAYQDAGRQSEAIALFETALKFSEAKLGPDHPDTLLVRNNVTTSYLQAGRLADVITLHEKEFMRVQSPFGPDDPRTLQRAANLAMAFKAVARAQRDSSRHQEAVRSYRRAVTIQDDLVKRRPEMAIYKNALAWFLTDFGMCLREVGLVSEAEGALERALAIWLGRISEQSSVTFGSMENLLWTLDELGKVGRPSGRVGKAIAAYRRAMEATARIVTAHPEVPRHTDLQAELHEKLGLLLAESGRSTEAMSLRRQAVALREQALERCASTLGFDHPDTLTSRTHLIDAYESLGRWADAEPLHRNDLALRRKTAKPDSLMLADNLTNLGRNLLKQKKASDAEPLLRESLAIRGKAAPDDWCAYDAMSLLGEALISQRRFAEAELLVEPGYEGMRERKSRIAAIDRIRLREAGGRVVRLYEDWGKTQQAAAWKAKLDIPDLPADVFAHPSTTPPETERG